MKSDLTTVSVSRRYQIPLAVGAFAAAMAAQAACAAPATDTDGWYVRAAITGSDLQKPKQTIANAPTPGTTLQVVNAVDFGWGGAVAAGRSFGPLRLEAEIGRTANKSAAYSAVSPLSITLPQDGKNDVTRYMANIYADLPPFAEHWRLYVGAGLGTADVHVTTFAAPARAPNAPPSQLIDFHSHESAYQVMAGSTYALGPHWALTAQYRWFDAGTAKGHDSRGEQATRDIAGHNVDLGVKYVF
jgi:opacity protein-like surface antigen